MMKESMIKRMREKGLKPPLSGWRSSVFSSKRIFFIPAQEIFTMPQRGKPRD